MTTLFGHDVRSELVLLYVLECLICFIIVYPVVAFADVWVGGPVNGAAVVTALVLALFSGAASGASGLYRPANWARTRQLILGTAAASVLLLPVVVLLLSILAPPGSSLPTWRGLADTALATACALALTRLGFIGVQRAGWLTWRIALIGSPSTTGQIEFPVRGLMGTSLEIVLRVPPGASLEHDLRPDRLKAKRIWGIAAASEAELPDAVRALCARMKVNVLAGPAFLESHLGRVNTAVLQDGWLDDARAMRQGRIAALIVRVLDLAFASALLIVTLPVLVLTAIAIKCDSPGPVFYRQQRVGLGGRTFPLVKFRSMKVDAERGGVAVWATRADDRVTRVGRFIRLVRIDEIPQVLNVIRGDMAFIGPRPERPAIVEMLAMAIPHYHDRACVKPGITGWAQVNFPYGASVEDTRMKLAYDLYYVKRRSLFLDLLIMVATVRVVLFQEGSR